MEKIINIKTNLLYQEELFKVILLAHLAKLPVLIYGDAGTGKTQAVFEFCKSLELKLFSLQLNFDTQRSEIFGQIDIKSFLERNEIVRLNGISEETQFLLIDEIDKANSQVKNLFLSILREKQIFDGRNIIQLNPNLSIVATSNNFDYENIENEEKAFYDRFALYYKAKKISNEKLLDILSNTTATTMDYEYIFKIKNNYNPKEYQFIINILKNLNHYLEELSNRKVVYLNSIIKNSLRFLNIKETINLIITIFKPETQIILLENINKILERKKYEQE